MPGHDDADAMPLRYADYAIDDAAAVDIFFARHDFHFLRLMPSPPFLRRALAFHCFLLFAISPPLL